MYPIVTSLTRAMQRDATPFDKNLVLPVFVMSYCVASHCIVSCQGSILGFIRYNCVVSYQGNMFLAKLEIYLMYRRPQVLVGKIMN